MNTTSRPALNLPSTEFAARTKKLNGVLRRLKLDALFIHSPVNRYYFTGLMASNGIILAERGEEPLFFTDFRYLIAARKEVGSMPSKLLWKAADHAKVVAGFGSAWKRVGYEGTLSAERYLKLKAALPDAEWIDISEEIAKLRAVKSSAERAAMRRACAANDRLLERVLARIEFGMSEWEISAMIRRECDVLGQGPAFEPIVCVGRNGAECHHHPETTALRRNMPLLLDLGVRLDHYCSDMTRSVFFGRATAQYRKIYRIVRDANRRAIDRIRPGVTCGAIDKVARDSISRAGYGKCFDHGLGHGLGLEVHEYPNFSSGSKTLLETGMVLTVEPGIYIANRVGIRVEDVILVTRDGCEVLSESERSGMLQMGAVHFS